MSYSNRGSVLVRAENINTQDFFINFYRKVKKQYDADRTSANRIRHDFCLDIYLAYHEESRGACK